MGIFQAIRKRIELRRIERKISKVESAYNPSTTSDSSRIDDYLKGLEKLRSAAGLERRSNEGLVEIYETLRDQYGANSLDEADDLLPQSKVNSSLVTSWVADGKVGTVSLAQAIGHGYPHLKDHSMLRQLTETGSPVNESSNKKREGEP